MRNIILIVESSREIKGELTKKILEVLGNSVHLIPCSTLRKATNEFIHRQVDVVLLSMTLEDTPGIIALEEIRRLNDDVPVIILDSDPSTQREQQSIAYGASSYFDVAKGFDKLPGVIVEALKIVRERRVSISAFEDRLDSIVKVVEGVSQTMSEFQYEVRSHNDATSLALNGTTESPGLVSQAKSSKAFISNFNKVFWIAISAIVTTIIGIIGAAITLGNI